MAFMNPLLRTLRLSALPMLLRETGSKATPLIVCPRTSQCRMLMVSHHWRSPDKPATGDTTNLDSWKSILRGGTQSPGDEKEWEVEEESSIESMQKLVEMWRLAGKEVPESITTEQLQELLTLTSKSARKKYLRDLLYKEYRKKSRERKKLEKQKLKSEMEISTERINTYLLKFWTKSEDTFHGYRAAQAMIHGQPLVFDMVYDHYMSRKEMENTVSQLMACEGFNRKSAEPFHLHFCSLQPDGPYHKELLNRYQEAFHNLLITSTDKAHIDIFPQDRLVYLTSDSPNVLKEFDHDKIYIVGAFVDKSQKTGVSLGNAKRLNIATARLPLDNYLKWDIGAKNLTINQVVEILMTVKDTGDWKNALAFVPTRKHQGFIKDLAQNASSPARKEARGHEKSRKSVSTWPKKMRW